jgi:hypothetical protein
VLFVDCDVRAGAWIASGSSRAFLDRKRAETAQLDAVTACQRGDDFAQDGVDDVFNVALIKVRILRSDTLNEF